MSVRIWLVLAIAIGALVYRFAPDKYNEMGRLTFGAGMLVLLATLAHRVVNL